MAEIETINEQMVSFNSDIGVTVLRPQAMETRQAAYRHAAWIVAMAEMLPDEPGQVHDDGPRKGKPYGFPSILNAVENT